MANCPGRRRFAQTDRINFVYFASCIFLIFCYNNNCQGARDKKVPKGLSRLWILGNETEIFKEI